jgi:signal transduction histidine kinase
MFDALSPKKRFTLTLILIHAVALPVITFVSYFILKENAVNDAYSAGRLYLSAVGGVKHYVEQDLRPLFYREMPGRFIVEGMSRSYAASSVAGTVRKELPNYIYKNASLYPKNPANSADDFERGVIGLFVRDRTLREWEGFSKNHGGHYYVIARPGEPFGSDCMLCHGDPAAAPKELLARYGPTAGFHMRPGELADATFVYIPISVALASARKAVAVFVGIYILIGTIIILVINGRFSALYDRIDTDRQRIEGINREIMNLNRDMEAIIAERTMNLIALSVADRVRNPAAAVAGTINRLLRKEELEGPLRERLQGLIAEAGKLETIVRDYEQILRTRHTMFQVEDLNDIVRGVLPLMETERKARSVVFDMKLSEAPLRCMANKQFLRVALQQILRNAVEAAPEGGKVTIESGAYENNVAVSISDDGSGIPPGEISRVFDLFYSTKQHSMGMGLPLVKQIVEEHRGRVEVESEEGRGTTFRLIFPVRWSEEGLSSHKE